MRWKLRAWLLGKMARLPGGYSAYQLLQRCAGLHCKPAYLADRLTAQRDLARQILESGGTLNGARVVEVGTGWVPLGPIGFWICGAEEVRTYDIHRHLLPSVLKKALCWMGGNQEPLVELWKGVAPAERVRDCLRIVREKSARPWDVLREARISYLAPADAACTGLPDASTDIHYSISVLEHVSHEMILAILHEGRRVLKSTGRTAHFIDPTDHFAFFDDSITDINFLQYTNDQWRRYAGNALAYHNRLRDGDFEGLFAAAGFQVLEHTFALDTRAYQALRQDFKLAAEFRDRDPEEVCRRDLVFVGG